MDAKQLENKFTKSELAEMVASSDLTINTAESKIEILQSQIRRMHQINRHSDKLNSALGLRINKLEQKVASAEFVIGKMAMKIHYSDAEYPESNNPFLNIKPYGTSSPPLHDPWEGVEVKEENPDNWDFDENLKTYTKNRND